MSIPVTQDQAEPIGVLLTNLGTPDSPEVPDVRRYLKEFLSDPRVVTMPRWIWWPMLNGVILNTRPKKSARAYQKIWTDEGSPLLTISKQQADALQVALDQGNQRYVVQLAMRYGKPSIQKGLEGLRALGIQRIVVLALYPQFSHTTTSSTLDAVNQALAPWAHRPEIRFIERYYDHPDYIDALARSVKDYWDENGRAEKLVLSFHGIPKDYIDGGDPYATECSKTASLLAEALGLKESDWLMTYQSRLGPREWLRPYTDQTLASIAKSGVKDVQILCPGFSVDCLETLEEIQMENREVFLEGGGQSYHYIPCLNAHHRHIEMMASLIKRYFFKP